MSVIWPGKIATSPSMLVVANSFDSDGDPDMMDAVRK